MVKLALKMPGVVVPANCMSCQWVWVAAAACCLKNPAAPEAACCNKCGLKNRSMHIAMQRIMHEMSCKLSMLLEP